MTHLCHLLWIPHSWFVYVLQFAPIALLAVELQTDDTFGCGGI